MSKIYILLGLTIFGLTNIQSQTVTAPITSNTSTQVRLPNGLSSYAYHRAIFHIPASELATFPNNGVINFIYTNLTVGTNIATSGNIQVYLQNTLDAAMSKSTTYATAITGMTEVYNGNYTIPATTTATTIEIALPTGFTYTGAGLYLATNFYSAGPYATSPATYAANSTIAGSCLAAFSGSEAPTTLGPSAFRPSITYSNTVLSTNSFSNQRLSSFENPVSEVLKINNIDQEINFIEIYDFLGRKILKNNSNNEEIQIDVQSLKTGTYIIKMTNKENKILTSKMIKK